MPTNRQTTYHQPVLLNKVLELLSPRTGESYLDLTAGYGGHAEAVLEKTDNFDEAVLIDRDSEATRVLQQAFGKLGAKIINQDFYSASQDLKSKHQHFDMILADLGVSSPHLDKASRGFSFEQLGPLDMRMDQTQPLSADKIINHYSEKELVDILRRFGEEPKAKKIAHLILVNRPIQNTTQLANIVAKVWSKSRTHPATRTFQAIRIAVNDELEQLNKSLPIWLDLLKPGGRIAIISFHSLEDRLVKQAFAQQSGNRYDATLKLLTKKPITGDKNEIAFNPRARSAKLRAAAKIKINPSKTDGLGRGTANAHPGKKQLPNL